MRVLPCKSYCPSICFSKSSLSLHSPCPLKLEDAQNNISSQSPSEEKIDVEEKNKSSDVKVEIFLKSSLKKSPGSGSEEVGKGRVKWMDFVGKELVEIKEFEPIESEEPEDDDGGNQACVCVIQ